MDRSLWDALAEVPDRRGRQGRHYPLRSLLGISLAAILAGANDLRSIYRWGQRLRSELRLFGIESGRAPCHATWALPLSRARCRRAGGDARASRPGRGGGHIAVGGKSLRGSHRARAPALHVLSAFGTDPGAVIGDLVVQPEANEITGAQKGCQ
jgi:hypothetical protein